MVWVTGCNGMLGTQVCHQLKAVGIDFEGSDSVIDITNPTTLESFAKGKSISCIVNCAAYTAVDKAESDEKKAHALNAVGAGNLALLAKKLGCPLIHISTDYVFDGSSSSPISEDTPIKPLGVYGETKAAGEKAVQDALDDFYILRTAWLYGFNGKNFVYTMIRAMNSHESVKVVADQRGTPTNCTTLATVIVKIIEKRLSGESVTNGIYHVTDMGETTWFDFTNEIKRIAGDAGILTNKACAVTPCTTAEYPTPAKRPAYSVLSKEKIQQELSISLPDWKKSLVSFITSAHFDMTRLN